MLLTDADAFLPSQGRGGRTVGGVCSWPLERPSWAARSWTLVDTGAGEGAPASQDCGKANVLGAP